MAGLPGLPLSGTTLSQSLDLDRISMIENHVGNANYPVGQYVFFTKSKSIWYRYTNATTPWTSDILYVSNARESNVKFDLNGNPFSAFISNVDNSIKIRHVANGIDSIKTISPSGRFPTVQIDPNDIYLFWVPFPYNGNLEYCQGCDFFSTTRLYPFAAPSPIQMLNVQLESNNKWVFTVTYEGNPSNRVYRVVTNTIA